MKIDGIEYETRDLDFTNILCDLEDQGIDIMSMTGENMKPFNLCRGIISAYTGEKDMKKCGKIFTSHLKNGGTIEDILEPFTEAMEAAGFGNPGAEVNLPTPQDHKKKKPAKTEVEGETE